MFLMDLELAKRFISFSFKHYISSIFKNQFLAPYLFGVLHFSSNNRPASVTLTDEAVSKGVERC